MVRFDITQPTMDSGVFLDTTRPHAGRVMNYLVGGKVYFAIDKKAAEELLTLMPSLRKWVRLQYAFIHEAAQALGEEGFEQFLDIASGIPTQSHLHTFLPNAHIVYSDANPVAVSYGSSLLAEFSDVAFVQGNARSLGDILEHPDVRRLISPLKKVAIGLNNSINFLRGGDVNQLLGRLYEWAPAGSKAYAVLHQIRQVNEQNTFLNFQEAVKDMGLYLNLHPAQDYKDLLAPWEIKLIEPVESYLGLSGNRANEDDEDYIELDSFAVILEKSV